MAGTPVDARFVHRTAVLRIVLRMIGAGATAGALLGTLQVLAAGGLQSAATALGTTPFAALIGLGAGTLANTINAWLAVVALRRWPAAVVRWAVVPIPVVAALVMSLTMPCIGVTIAVGATALVIAVVLGPWCLAPANDDAAADTLAAG